MTKQKLSFRKPLWLVKIMHFEYWPLWLIYLPVSPYWLWLMMKCRSFRFYRYVNPSILNGGLKGESKKLILDAIDPVYKPVTLFFRKGISVKETLRIMADAALPFPVIAKPDVGEKGRGVELIFDSSGLDRYIRQNPVDFLLQEYVDYPVELAIFYVRYPAEPTGRITSVTTKNMLTVTGDGISEIRDLMLRSDRARFQIKRLSKANHQMLRQILPDGETRILEVVGNHCRGTQFMDGGELINEKLAAVFDRISLPVKDFYFGRYDLRVTSLDDLYQGKNIRIVELNGVGAIPAHVFDPDFKWMQAWKDIVFHWKMAGEIALVNKRDGRRIYSVP